MKHATLNILLTSLLLTGCGEISQPIKLALAPEVSPPGEEITLTYKENAGYPIPLDSLKVFVGKEAADLILVQKGTIRFLLPELAAGTVDVSLQSEAETVGKATFKVQAHPTKKILFAWKNGEAQQIGEKLTNDSLSHTGHTEATTKSSNMLYGVYSMGDELLQSGNIDNATTGSAGHEIFPDPNGTIRKEQAEQEGSFSVLVPNVKKSFMVKIFKRGAILKKGKASLIPDTHLIQQIPIKNN
jgi:hypothetical protein